MKTNLLDLPLHLVIALWLYQAIERRKSKDHANLYGGDLVSALDILVKEIEKIIYVPTHTPTNFLERFIHRYYWHLYNEYWTLYQLHVRVVGFIRRDDDRSK